ncbi:MAG: tRNA lysidine(34) synthetase TilS [Erysipelotrichaceae bacterium]|nr:tRNA lysidine(34) synthetase TilS [Erysipelotrichaceae bacterium]
MALLSLCLRQGYDVIVCHVNYRLRKNADREEELVRAFCRENGIEIHVDYPVKRESGNFQNWAREARYDFYRRIYLQENCTALLLGHQKDDHVENYLMSLQRGSRGWYYGIRRQTVHHGMLIIRPLLDVRKRETRQYCLDNSIPFGDDESNFTDHYSRNRIRHEMVEKADDAQIEQWCRQIEELNLAQQQKISHIEVNYHEDVLSLEAYRQEDREMRHLILRHLISRFLPDNPSEDFISETDRLLTDSEGNHHLRLNGRYTLFVDYGTFYVCDVTERYSYQLERNQLLQTPYFRICLQGETIERIGVNEDEWPLTIRSAEPGDEIELRYGTKKLNRFFTDRKIPHGKRLLWPVVLNCRGEVIFVAGIGCERHHFFTNEFIFMIK